MQAVILAAGMGKRLKELTRHNTKCMVKVNGVPLVERMLHQLEKYNVSRIVIVIGYKKEELIAFVKGLNLKTPVVFINNPVYDKTNNIYSLSLAKEYLLEEDTILLESDLVFEDEVLEELMRDKRQTLALVDKYESWMDGTCVKVGEDDSIDAFVPGKRFNFEEIAEYYKTVNIYKFSRHFSATHYVPFLEAYSKALGNNEYYEQVLRVITMLDDPEIKAKKLTGQKWYEIDDIQDLDIAESIFATKEEEKVERLQKRYGGYWRYPKLLDFCYLVNPYFPPKRMMDEMKTNFDTLLTEYPSGMEVNSLLAAKNYGVHQENIVVGNGAAELIKSFMSYISGKTGFVRPTFDEYPNRYPEKDSVVYMPEKEGFRYSSGDLMNFFEDKEVHNLIVVNPDNPSGNYIPHKEMLDIVSWAKERSINILIDESFADFAEDSDHSLLTQKFLDTNEHVTVMKSISKSYGVPGLRLGVLASGNQELVAWMKKDISIWNINSFAEFYMQIYEKYQWDYEESLARFRNERKRFQKELSKIRGFEVYPSQANFILVKVNSKVNPRGLLTRLLVDHGILIKELTTKTNGKNYLRIAVRKKQDNDRLLAALKEILD